MSDVKLFRISPLDVAEIKGAAVALEKSLQVLIEKNLDVFLGVRFLASEFSTGRSHAGRIDTLGIDENGCPVIIEYKRAVNENVINQGLFYLDWLLDHKGDFKVLVIDCLGHQEADSIDWSAPRLLCIAGGFTKYDEHAIQQINRNIDLIRYRKYGDELLLFELVNRMSAEPITAVDGGPDKEKGTTASNDRTLKSQVATAPTWVSDMFEAFKSFCLALGDDVQLKTLKHYYAFRRMKNFACVEVKKNHLIVYLYVDPDTIKLVDGFTRDVRKVGHWGTGTLEIKLDSQEDFELTKPLIIISYESS